MKPSETLIEALPISTATVIDYIHAVLAQSNDRLPVLLATLLVPVKHDWQMIPSTFRHRDLGIAFAWIDESDISGRRGDAGADGATFGASLPPGGPASRSKV